MLTKNCHAITCNDQSFQKDGQSYFILSGEMHYFRIDADLWEKHLQKMKEAGLNTVSSYVPWSLHEQIEGEPDFEGKYVANLNLIRFIDLCKKTGLDLILKPGPYILAELQMHGIPRWFFKNYPSALAHDVNGKPYTMNYTCLTHPDYRGKAMQWYDAIMPIIATNQTSNNGPISLIQVCNEVGLFQWLGGAGDYSVTSQQDYRNYLSSIYNNNIDELNLLYDTNYKSWQEITPPSGPVKTKAHYFAYRNWHSYHRSFYAKYIGWLINEIRNRNVDTTLFHNVPGWVFGRAKNMPVCLSMYHELAKQYPDILLGVDHIPENPSYRNFHDDRIINAFTKAIQGNRGPTYVAELQAGTREANVEVYPTEMELFYKACLANGVVAMNYYMFSQGENPPGWGVYDSTFYLQTPLDVKGQQGDSYPITKRIGQLLKTHGNRLCDSTTHAKQALVFYPPYYYRELSCQLFTGENIDDPTIIGCVLETQMVMDQLLFDSLGKLLAMDNQEFDAIDITNTDIYQLDHFKQIWVASTELMDKNVQETLLQYIRSGGHLICFPTLPQFDLNAKPCTILVDGLNIQSQQVTNDPHGMIRWADTNEEIHALSYIETFTAANPIPIAYTRDNNLCALKVSCDNGSATVFGSGFNFQATTHKLAWQKLGLSHNFKTPITCDNPRLITRTRSHKEKGGFLFILNYHNQKQKTTARLANAKLPTKGHFYLPPCSALILPFDLPITEDCTLNSTTSEIISIDSHDNTIVLVISGHPITTGEITLQSTKQIKKILLNNHPQHFIQSKNITSITYTHTQTPITLKIEL